MNRSMGNLNWQRIASFISFVFVIGLLFLSLLGCASSKSKHPPIQTDTRQAQIQAMRAAGVKVFLYGETVRLVLPSDRFFAPRSANLNDESNSVFNTMSQYIRSYKTVDIRVTGYSDNRAIVNAPKNFQDALTARQAEEIVSELWDLGINTRLLYAVGKGNDDPVAWNGSSEGRSINRRVEISFRFYPEYNRWD